MGTLNNNSKVGDKGKDLILQTSGRVYVQVKDRFYPKWIQLPLKSLN